MTASESQQPTAPSRELVASLQQPQAYPWRPERVDLIETHISWVFLAGDFVVKVKRPVRFGFVDHLSADARRASCEDEVRLNRRLTSGVYLDVVPIMRERDGYAVEGIGPVVEWATLMRRLSADAMLDRLLLTGNAPADVAERLAARLIPFHTETAADCGVESVTNPTATTQIVTENLEELRPFAGSILSRPALMRVDHAVRGFIEQNGALFASRANQGLVRDGHGDLRCEHVCLDGEVVQIFDCVEFSRSIRCADIASDLAFLLMDLKRLGAESIASELLGRYRDAGVDLPDSLLRLFSAHRALVRSKVACLTPAGEHTEPAAGLVREARDYLASAHGDVFCCGPVLLAMTGLSGCGKSTVAQAVSRSIGSTVFTSDLVRKEIAGVAGAAPTQWRIGLYGPEWTERTYRALLERASDVLQTGQPVMIDAAFLESDQRQRAAELARRLGLPFVLVEVTCDEETAHDRLARRATERSSPSDADWTIHQEQRRAWQSAPPAVPAGAIHVVLESSEDRADLIEPVIQELFRLRALREALAPG